MGKKKLDFDNLPLWVACDRWLPMIQHVVDRGCEFLRCDEVRIPHDHFLEIDFRGTVEDLPEFKPGECNGQMKLDSNSNRVFCRCCYLQLVEPPYDRQGVMSEERIVVQKDGKYGYLDKSKKLVIPLDFDDAKDFHSGLAAVLVNDKWGYIDPQGKTVIEPRFRYAGEFIVDETAYVADPGSDEAYLINTKGQKVASTI